MYRTFFDALQYEKKRLILCIQRQTQTVTSSLTLNTCQGTVFVSVSVLGGRGREGRKPSGL